MLTALEATSQQSSDTVCIPASQLKKAVARLEDCKVLKEDLDLTIERLAVATSRLELKDSVISSLKAKSLRQEELSQNGEERIKNLERQKSNLEKSLDLQNKAFRRQRLSKWITGALGLAAGILIAK